MILDKLQPLAKIGRFLHLVEDDLQHLSLSGVQLWATTILSIEQLAISTDHFAQMISAASAAGAGGLHAVKRYQTLAGGQPPQPEPLPPWTGEAD